MFSSKMDTSPVAVTYSAVTYGSQSKSSEKRVRTPRPEAGSTSAVHPLPRIDAAQHSRICVAGQVRAGMQQCQHILELVAEPKRSAGLVQTQCDPTDGR